MSIWKGVKRAGKNKSLQPSYSSGLPCPWVAPPQEVDELTNPPTLIIHAPSTLSEVARVNSLTQNPLIFWLYLTCSHYRATSTLGIIILFCNNSEQHLWNTLLPRVVRVAWPAFRHRNISARRPLRMVNVR